MCNTFQFRETKIVHDLTHTDGLSRLALVAMVKSSDLRNRHDAPAFWLLHGSRFRSIFGQRQMSSGTLVIGKIALIASRSRRRYLHPWSQGKASRICCMVHSWLGCSVT